MKLLHLSFLVSGLLFATIAFSQTRALQSSAYLSYDTGSGSIFYGDSLTYTYFPAQKHSEQSGEWTWGGTPPQWLQSMRWLDHQFDGNGNLTYVLAQTGDDVHGWKDFTRSYQNFDAANNLLIYWQENWDGLEWDTSFFFVATYNSDGNVLTQLGDTYRYTYTYDTQGNLSESLYEAKIGNTWTPYTRQVFVIAANGEVDNYTEYSYVNGTWVEKQKVSSTYDGANHLTQTLFQNWDNGSWVNSLQLLFSYDAAGNPIEELFQFWQANGWQDGSRAVFTYDNQANILTLTNENKSGNAWVTSSKGWNHYMDYLPVFEPGGLSVQVFPNPTASLLTLKGGDLSRMEIYNQAGELLQVQALNGKDQHTMPLHLPAGQYVLKVSDHKGNMATKALQVIR